MSFAILIVEDDCYTADVLRQLLAGEGYQVHIASNISEAKHVINNLSIDLVLLDVNLEALSGGKNSDFVKLVGDSLLGQEGFEVAAWLRDTYRDIRIIFLTSANDISDRIRGLDLGGDDYVLKPFHPAELKARIRSTLRRSDKKVVEVEVFNNWKLESNLNQISHLRNPDMIPISLTTAEKKVLVELLNARGETVSRESLSKRVFGRPLSPHDRGVDSAISKLRAKLNDEKNSVNRIIETMHGSGYRIVRR